MRTDQQIVDETNALARHILAEIIGTGYEAPPDYKFYEADNPRGLKAWDQAVKVMEMLTHTDANDALANLGKETPADSEPKEYTLRIGVTVRAFTESVFEAASIEDAIAQALKHDPQDWVYRNDHSDIEGDEIGYLRESNNFNDDEIEIPLREDGEPYSWDAVDIVKKMAKLAREIGDSTIKYNTKHGEIIKLLYDARNACTKEPAPKTI